MMKAETPDLQRKRVRAWAEVAKMRNAFQDKRRCEICGVTRSLRDRPLVGHHWRGYDHPRDVWWVCDSCHKRLRDFGAEHDGSVTLEAARALFSGTRLIP